MEYNIQGIIRGVQRGASEIKIRFRTDTSATRPLSQCFRPLHYSGADSTACLDSHEGKRLHFQNE
jgi:hypothetical protein